MEEKSKVKLDEIGGVGAVARGVGSSLKRGLSGNDDVRRRSKYGVNKVTAVCSVVTHPFVLAHTLSPRGGPV